jgi:Ni/Fe-hydrogenase subunit HybB-like protein
MKLSMPKLTFWRVLFAVLMILGAYATIVRFTQGLGASTNLSDEFPWGMWIGFDVLCGVMLAAGGFTLMATVHIFNIKDYKPVARPALLTAFLGYILVVGALMYDLGKPWNVWHPIVMWQPRSVMFEVGWCVMLYTTVLSLEFLPIVFEKLRYEKPLRILRMISAPLFILGVILSTLHQSSLGSLYLIVPNKLHPLWYTGLLPVLFFLSALAVGLAMTIFESTMSSRHFNHALNPRVIQGLGRILTVVLLLYAVVRLQNMISTGAIAHAFVGSSEASMFWVEITLAVLMPIVLLLIPKVRENPIALYVISIMVVLGFVLNRLNVAITGMEGAAGVQYIPRWTEVTITAAIIAFGVFVFTMAVKYLPIFHSSQAPSKARESALPVGVQPIPAAR